MMKQLKFGYCVNALSRAHVISTPARLRKRWLRLLRVNALSRAHVISTPQGAMLCASNDRVNALSRAHSISTPTPKIA